MDQNESANPTPESSQTPPPQTPPQAPQLTPVAEPSKDDKTMAMLCHLLAIFTGFLGPLILWLVKKDQSPYIDEQGKEALNFQITVAIALFVSGLLTYVCIGAFLLPLVWLGNLIFCIMACVAANKGEHYKYPVSLRLVS